MKKWIYFFFVTMGLLVFSGCVDEEAQKKEQEIADMEVSVESQLDKTLEAINADKTLSTYLSNVEYQRDTDFGEDAFRYDVVGGLDDSFDTLSKKEQYDFFAHAVDVIREANKKNNGGFECGDYLCFIYELKFETGAEEYAMNYGSEEETNRLEVGGYEEYLADGSEYKQYPTETTSSTSTAETTSGPDTNPSTANGDDWMQMSASQKTDIVSTVFSTLESKGYTILEGPEWFVESLDAFYGDPATNSTTVTDIMALSGVGGEVIIAP